MNQSINEVGIELLGQLKMPKKVTFYLLKTDHLKVKTKNYEFSLEKVSSEKWFMNKLDIFAILPATTTAQ